MRLGISVLGVWMWLHRRPQGQLGAPQPVSDLVAMGNRSLDRRGSPKVPSRLTLRRWPGHKQQLWRGESDSSDLIRFPASQSAVYDVL